MKATERTGLSRGEKGFLVVGAVMGFIIVYGPSQNLFAAIFAGIPAGIAGSCIGLIFGKKFFPGKR